jgi:uncharacterized protein (DUF4415 family)
MGMTGKKSATKSTWTDPDDAPELTEEWFATADLYEGNKLIRRGRPAKAAPKEAVNIRLDPDGWPISARPGWQSRINEMLRKAAGL